MIGGSAKEYCSIYKVIIAATRSFDRPLWGKRNVRDFLARLTPAYIPRFLSRCTLYGRQRTDKDVVEHRTQESPRTSHFLVQSQKLLSRLFGESPTRSVPAL